MLRRLFAKTRPEGGGPDLEVERNASMPRGVRLYAIGDIHGRVDLLQRLEAAVAEDAQAQDGGRFNVLVYLGDYVDRGPHSREVVDHLVNAPLEGFRAVHLIGNHDYWLREVLNRRPIDPAWLQFGGDATLMSYGVRMNFKLSESQRLVDAAEQLRASVPTSHRRFLDALESAFSLGDYFFCHAGIRPEVSFEEQTDQDLMWIREPFLNWTRDWGKVVVHGHTVVAQPAVKSNRIGIDTGAVWTGTLTCLVLEGSSQTFMMTSKPADGG